MTSTSTSETGPAGKPPAPRLSTFGTLLLLIGVYSLLVPVCAGLAVYVVGTGTGFDPIIATVLLTAGILVLAGASVVLLHGRVVRPLNEVLAVAFALLANPE